MRVSQRDYALRDPILIMVLTIRVPPPGVGGKLQELLAGWYVVWL